MENNLNCSQEIEENEIISEDQEEKIKAILEWIHLDEQKGIRPDRKTALRFLQWAKWDIEKSQIRLRSYFINRVKMSEWFTNRDVTISPLNDLIKIGVFIPLNKLDEKNQLILLIRPTSFSPQNHHLTDLFKISQIIADLLIYDKVYGEAFCNHGVMAIVDLKNFTLGHAKQYSPFMVTKIVNAMQNSYPARIKCLAFVNAPRYINMILKLFLTPMSKKLKERVKVYDTFIPENFVNISLLPIEYGGILCSLQDLIDYWENYILQRVNWIKQDEQYKLNK